MNIIFLRDKVLEYCTTWPCEGVTESDQNRVLVTVPVEAAKRRIKGTVWPDWICMRLPDWYHWIGLEKDINRCRFLFFIFDLWIFEKSSKFWAASCKNESNLLLVWIAIYMCSICNLFRLTVLQKCGRDISCSLDYGSWIKNSNIPQSKPKYSSTLADFFIKYKCSSQYEDWILCKPWSEKAGGSVHFCIKRSKLWCLFKAYPMVQLM